MLDNFSKKRMKLNNIPDIIPGIGKFFETSKKTGGNLSESFLLIDPEL